MLGFFFISIWSLNFDENCKKQNHYILLIIYHFMYIIGMQVAVTWLKGRARVDRGSP